MTSATTGKGQPRNSDWRCSKLDLFLGREVESLETQVLTDPALMLVLNPLAAGGFHSQNGRQIELAAEKVVADGVRMAGRRSVQRG